MRIEKLKMKHKGQPKEFDVAIPETINEATKLIGPKAVYEDFVQGLLLRSKREALGIKKKRKRILRLNLDNLPEDLAEALRKHSLTQK